MKRQCILLPIVFVLVGISSAVRLSAEVTRLPFFAPEAVFTESACAFPAVSTWMVAEQVLNQDSVDTAHCLDTGSILTFWSGERMSLSGLVREMFRFKPQQGNPYKFWAQDLVTDLRLTASFKLDPFILGAGYRHDCKHDVSDTVRLVIHDALYVQALYPVRALPFSNNTMKAQAGFALEAEANLSPVFQSGEEEPDRGRLSADVMLVPFRTENGHFGMCIDGRVSLIRRAQEARVAVESPWNVDWVVRAGPSFSSGLGELGIFYSLERITDDWANLTPTPRTVSAISLSLMFGASKQ